MQLRQTSKSRRNLTENQKEELKLTLQNDLETQHLGLDEQSTTSNKNVAIATNSTNKTKGQKAIAIAEQKRIKRVSALISHLFRTKNAQQQPAKLIVKLTETYMQAAIKALLKNAKLTCVQHQQLAYFQSKQKDSNSNLIKLTMPHILPIYKQLRMQECLIEKRIQQMSCKWMLQEVFQGDRRPSKIKKVITNYFQAQFSEQVFESFKEKQQKRPQTNNIVIKAVHLIDIVEEDRFLRDHDVLWRFKIWI